MRTTTTTTTYLFFSSIIRFSGLVTWRKRYLSARKM